MGKPEVGPKLADSEKIESMLAIDDGNASVDSSFLTVASSRKIRAQSLSSSTVTSVPSTSDLDLGSKTISERLDGCNRKSNFTEDQSNELDVASIPKPASSGSRLLTPVSANRKFMDLISRTKTSLLGSPNSGTQGSSDGSYDSGASPIKRENFRKRRNNKNRDGPISLAVLTETGIQIKLRDPSLGPKAKNNNRYDNTPDWNSEESDKGSTNDDSYFETTSLISCVTCLSETTSNSSVSTMSSTVSTQRSGSNNLTHHHIHTFNGNDKIKLHSYSSVNGQLPTNSVIPYSRILNARYLGKGKAKKKDQEQQQDQEEEDLDFDKGEYFNDNNYDYDYSNGFSPLIPPNLPENQYLVELTFAKPTRHDVKPKSLTLLIEYDKIKDHGSDDSVVEEILRRSYRNSKRHRTILVIVNPFGGRRNAKKIFKRKARPLLMASGFDFDVTYTKYPGHATKIASTIDISKYDTIACASGDGIPHEVLNGLYRRPDRVIAFNKLAITQIPCGSGNAMSVSCHWTNNPSYATLSLIKSIEKRIDVMCCSQESYLTDSSYPKLSFLSQTYGIIAESDINTEFIRWMGPARFELGVAYNILQKRKYPCDIYVKYFAKTKNELKSLYLKYKNEQEISDAEVIHRVESVEIINPRRSNGGKDSETGENKSVLVSTKYHDKGSESVLADTFSARTPQGIDNYVTEESFKIKYPIEEGIPSDWEKVDEGITNNLGIFYTGKMPYVAADTKFFPAASPSDGVMDMVIIDSRTPFTRMVPILLALDKGSHVLQPEVLHSKICAYKIIPKGNDTDSASKNREGKSSRRKGGSINGLYSIDGEKFPLEPLQVEVMPKLLKTLLRDGRFVDTEFDSM